ncbi:MAG: TetR family transcriptional regulator [Alphaproteobacteria bacterium]|nr:TetR family transcriptional regulator [Alphaproteobacteria bacterium]
MDGASVDAIADAAGVAKATVYARYRDKEELFVAAVQSKCAEFMDADSMASSPGRSVREGLRLIGRKFLDLITAPEPLAMLTLMSHERQRNPHLPRLFFESAILPTQAKVARFLEDETKRGRLIVPDPSRAAWQFLGMIKSEEHMREILGMPRRSEDVRNAYIGACVDVFLAAHTPKD